ncbi:hypothetical protein H2203_002920 [Taxawa tesnikishii (nom. ined.)]|nr:hypothetical protein H2203_002920 [Dothideales sp. JES 119]
MSAAPAVDTLNGVINDHIVNHPLAKSLRADPAFRESRPHLKIPPTMRAHNLTGGTLLGDEKLAVPPLNFANVKAELPTLVQISHVGDALCGHPGIIHGGMLATLLDEGLARACFPALPNKVGVTASLTINYRKPCPANAYTVLRAETTKVEGRKAWVKGWIEVLGEGIEEGSIWLRRKRCSLSRKVQRTWRD